MQNAYLRASAETEEELQALLDTKAVLIYMDSGYFSPETWGKWTRKAHEAGKLLLLRLPHIFRREGAEFLREHQEKLRGASFDGFLLRSFEELPWLIRTGLLEESGGTGTEGSGAREPMLVTDYNLYGWNSLSESLMAEIFRRNLSGEGWEEKPSRGPGESRELWETLPLELNEGELAALCKKTEPAIRHELLVYGRAPMMVSAQCIRRTVKGCDQKPCVMELSDRKGVRLPVKNNCTFCYNTILNSRPTVLYDLPEVIRHIGPDSIRYEFTTESGKEVKEILSGKRIYRENEFTRGYLRRGVE